MCMCVCVCVCVYIYIYIYITYTYILLEIDILLEISVVRFLFWFGRTGVSHAVTQLEVIFGIFKRDFENPENHLANHLPVFPLVLVKCTGVSHTVPIYDNLQ